MLQSAENTVKELMETGKPERHEKLVGQLKGIKAKWAEVTKLFEEVKQRPLKDLEVKFVSLHGNILSEMDNIFRYVKKLKLESPAVADIQSSLGDLEVRDVVFDFLSFQFMFLRRQDFPCSLSPEYLLTLTTSPHFCFNCFFMLICIQIKNT